MDISAQFGNFKSRIVRHEATNEIGHILEQTDRDVILERNRELRKNPDALRDLSFGRQIASIPFEDWAYFLAKNPNYRMLPKKQREKCLFDFLKFDSRGRACMVQDAKYKSKTKYHSVLK